MKRRLGTEQSPSGSQFPKGEFSSGISHHDNGTLDAAKICRTPGQAGRPSGHRRKRTDASSKSVTQNINLLEVRSSVAGIAGYGSLPIPWEQATEPVTAGAYELSQVTSPDAIRVSAPSKTWLAKPDGELSLPQIDASNKRSDVQADHDSDSWNQETVHTGTYDSGPISELDTADRDLTDPRLTHSLTSGFESESATPSSDVGNSNGVDVGMPSVFPVAPGDGSSPVIGGPAEHGFARGGTNNGLPEEGGQSSPLGPVVVDPEGPIICDWPPFVHFEKPIGAAQEGNSNPVMLRLSPYPDRIVAAVYTEPVYVDITHTGLTATTVTDYLVQDDDSIGDYTQQFVIPVGQTGRILPIQHHPDTVDEGLEDYRLQISGVQNGFAGNYSSFKGIISDEPLDGPPDVHFLDTFRNGGEGQSFGVRVGLSHSSLEYIRATVSPESLSAVFGQDFLLLDSNGYPVTSVELEFEPGEQVRQFNVQLLQDGVTEPREEYQLRISAATGARISSPDTFVGWVNDGIPSGDSEVTFVRSPEIGVEGTTVNFLVGLTAPSDLVVSASVVATGLSATAGVDFALQSGTVEFLPGETGKTVSVAHFTDSFVEQQEAYRLGLSEIVNASPGPLTTAEGWIVDESQIPRIFFADLSGAGMEGETEAIRVQLTNAVPFPVRVNLVPVDTGSANHPADYYVQLPGLTFAPGETSKLVNVLLKHDDVQNEGLENYKLRLADPQGASVAESSGEFTGYIEDADATLDELTVFDITANLPVVDNSGVVNFGSTEPAEPVIHEFRIDNRSSQSIVLKFSQLSLPNGFELVGQIGDTTVEANSSFSFGVRLLSENEGTYHGRLVLPNTSNGSTNPYDFTVFGIVRPDLPPGVSPLPVITLPEDFQGVYNGFNIHSLFSDPKIPASSLNYTVYRIDKYGLTDALSMAVSQDPNPPSDGWSPQSDLRPILVDPVESVTVTPGGKLDFSLLDDAFGFSHFLVVGRNPDSGQEVATTLMVEVTPVNDAPHIKFPHYPTLDSQQRAVLGQYRGPSFSPALIDLRQYFADFEDAGYLRFSVETDNEAIFRIQPAINPNSAGNSASNSGQIHDNHDGILTWRFAHAVGTANVVVTAFDRNGLSIQGVFQAVAEGLDKFHYWHDHYGAGQWNSFWGDYYTPHGWADPLQQEGNWNAKASFLDIPDTAFANSHVELGSGFNDQGLVERFTDQVAPDGSTNRVRQLAWQSDLFADRDLRNAYTDFLQLNSPFNSTKQSQEFSQWSWGYNGLEWGWLNRWFDFSDRDTWPGVNWERWTDEWRQASNVTGRPALLAYGWEYSRNGYEDQTYSYYGGEGTITFDFADDINLWVPAGLLYADDFGTEELFEEYLADRFRGVTEYGGHTWGFHGFGYYNHGSSLNNPGWNGELRQVQSGKSYHINPWTGWNGGGWGWGNSAWGGWWSTLWGDPGSTPYNHLWAGELGTVRWGPWGAVGLSWQELMDSGKVALPATLPVFIEGVAVNSNIGSIPELTVDVNLDRYWMEDAPGSQYPGENGLTLHTATDTESATYNYQVSDFSAGFHVPPNPAPADWPPGPNSIYNKHADLLVNSGDADNDGIPDLNDGFNADGVSTGTGFLDDILSPPAQSGFKELWIRIPKGIHQDARLSFNLQGVIDRDGQTTMDPADAGQIRIWNTNLSPRIRTPVTANGNLVFEPFQGSLNPTSIPLNTFLSGFNGGYTGEVQFIKLYVEALSPGRSALEIALDFSYVFSSPSPVPTAVRDLQAHGPALIDRVFFTNRDTISVHAVDRYAAERRLRSSVDETDNPESHAPDTATFRFDRRAGLSTSTVFFRLTGRPTTNENAPQSKAAPPGWSGNDFRLTVPDGTYLVFDPQTLVGAIQLNKASVEMDIEALSDGLVEVDEEVGIELLSRDQMFELLLRPGQSALDNHSSPVPMVLLDLLGLNHTDPPVGNSAPGIIDTLARSWYVVNPDASTAKIIIHDSDGFEFDSRAYDPVSTGDSRHSALGQYVGIDTRDGSASLLLPIDGMLPRYNGSDNLAPVLSLYTALPRPEFDPTSPTGSPTPVPDQIQATVTFAGIPSPQVQQFDRSTLSAVIGADPATQLRFLVTAPDSLHTKIPTGEYEFSVELSLKYGNKTLSRTVRGTTPFINRADRSFGSAEFGQRWTLAALDRILFTSGLAQVAGIATSSGNGSGTGGTGGSGGQGDAGNPPEPTTPGNSGPPPTVPLVRQGAFDHSGLSLIRGDNTSAFFDLPLQRNNYSELSVSSLFDSYSGAWPHGVSTNAAFPVDGSGSSTTRRVIATYNNLDRQTAYAVILRWPADGSLSKRVPVKITGAIPVGGNGTTHEYRIDQTIAHDDGYIAGFFVPSSAGQIKVEYSTEGTGNDRVHSVNIGLARAIDIFGFGNDPSSGEGTFSTIERLEKDWGSQTVTELVLKSQQTGTWKYFDAMGLLRVSEDRHGNLTRFAYTDGDNDGVIDDIDTIVLPGNRTYNYNYSSGYLNHVVSPTGQVTSFQNTTGNVDRVDLPGTGSSSSEDRFYSFGYGPGSSLNSVVDGRSNLTMIANPDGHGLVTTITSAGDSTVVRSELAAGFVISGNGMPDYGQPQPFLGRNNGRILIDEVIATAANELDQAFAEVTDPRNNTSRFQHDPRGLVTARVDQSKTAKWITDRNEHGQIIRQIEPARQVARFMGAMNPVNFTEAGIATEFTWDENHNLTKIRHAAGTDEELVEQWTWKLLTREIEDEELDLAWVQENYTAPDNRITRHEYADGQASPERIIENWQDGPGSGDPSDSVSRTTHFEYTPLPAAGSLVPAGLIRKVTIDGRSTETKYYGATPPPGISASQNEHRAGLVHQVIVSGGGLSHTTEYLIDDYRFVDRERSWYGSNPNPADIIERDYDYDRLGQLIQVVNPPQGFFVNPSAPTFDANGMPVVDGTRTGQLLKYHYDAAGNQTHAIKQRSRNDGSLYEVATVSAFDGRNRVQRIENPRNQAGEIDAVEFSRDGNGNVQRITEILGTSLRITDNIHDARNLLVTSMLPAPDLSGPGLPAVPAASLDRPVIHYVFDTNGSLLRETDPRFGAGLTPDDANGIVGTAYFYDIHGRRIGTHQDSNTPNDHLPPVTRTDFDAAGRIEAEYHSVGNGIGSPSNGQGIPAFGYAVTEYGYDGLGRLLFVEEPRNNSGIRRTTSYVWDSWDNLTEIRVGGDYRFGDSVETRLYDGLNRLVAVNHPSANYKPLGPDGTSSGTEVNTPGSFEAIGFDALGHAAVTLSAMGSIPSGFSGMLAAGASVGLVVARAREMSANGLPVRLTRTVQDRAGNLVASVSPDQNGESVSQEGLFDLDSSVVTVFSNDLSGNVIGTTVLFREFGGLVLNDTGLIGPQQLNPVSKLDSWTWFDDLNRPVREVGLAAVGTAESLRPEVETAYNADGTVRSKKEWKGNGANDFALTEWFYDNTGRLLRTVLPADASGNRMQQWSFADESGHVIETIDARNWRTSIEWDWLGRMIGRTEWVAAAAIAGGSQFDRPLETLYQYTADSLPKSVTSPNGDRQVHEHDPAGNLLLTRFEDRDGIATGDPAETWVRYDGHDLNGRAHRIVNDNGTTLVNFDSLGRMVQERLASDPRGAAAPAGSAIPFRTWQYDGFGNVVRTVDRNGLATDVTWYANGLKQSERIPVYDSLSPLVSNWLYTPAGELRLATNGQSGLPAESRYFYLYDDYRQVTLVSRELGGLGRSVVQDLESDPYGMVQSSQIQVDGLAVQTTTHVRDRLGRLVEANQTGPAVNDVKVTRLFDGPDLGASFHHDSLVGTGSANMVAFQNFSDGRVKSAAYTGLKPGYGTVTLNHEQYGYDQHGREVTRSAVQGLMPSHPVNRTPIDFNRPNQAGFGNYGRAELENDRWTASYDAEGNISQLIQYSKPQALINLQPETENAFRFISQTTPSEVLSRGTYRLKFNIPQSALNFDTTGARFAVYYRPTVNGVIQGEPLTTVPLEAWTGGHLELDLSEVPESHSIKNYVLVLERMNGNSHVSVQVPELLAYGWQKEVSRKVFEWNARNQLEALTETMPGIVINGQPQPSTVNFHDFQYDVHGHRTGSLLRSYLRLPGDVLGPVQRERMVRQVVDDFGSQLMTLVGESEAGPLRLVATSLLDEHGLELVIQPIIENPLASGNERFTPADRILVFRDQYGVARYVSDPDHTVDYGGTPFQPGFRELQYTTTGEALGGTLFHGQNGQAPAAELADVLTFFPGFDYEDHSKLWQAADGRTFNSDSGTFMNESRQSLHQGALNLYQRTALAPYGDINPNLQGFNYFAPDSTWVNNFSWSEYRRGLNPMNDFADGNWGWGLGKSAGWVAALPAMFVGGATATAAGGAGRLSIGLLGRYAATQTAFSVGGTAMEYGMARTSGAEFGWSEAGASFYKNMAVNGLTGGIGGTASTAMGVLGRFAGRKAIEVAGDTAYDVGILGHDPGRALVVNGLSSVGGELAVHGLLRGGVSGYRYLRDNVHIDFALSPNLSTASMTGLGGIHLSNRLGVQKSTISDEFLVELRGGGSWLMTEEQYIRYAKGAKLIGRPDGQFMTSARQMNILIHDTGGDPVKLGERLGNTDWGPKTSLIRMDASDPLLFNPRLPTSSMSGANSSFRPGGFTIGGIPEIATDQLPWNQVWATPVRQ